MRTIATKREVALFLTLLILLVVVFQLDVSFRFVTSVAPSEDNVKRPGTGYHSPLYHDPIDDEDFRTRPKKPQPKPAGEVLGGDMNFFFPGGDVPPSTLVAHVPGWTIIDQMYVMNGTVYLVTDEQDKFPAIRMMTSSGYRVENGAEEVAKREPSDKDMQIISTAKATELFGKSASRIDGTSFLVNDPPQFITHYYHFAAEMFFGLWRTYSSLDPLIPASGHTKLPSPRRLIFPHTPTSRWRDYAAMNQYVLRGAFPSLSLEFEDDWLDRSHMQTRVFVYDRVVFADRAASMRGQRFLATGRSASEAFALPGSPHWWSTIRTNVLESSGLKRQAGMGTRHTPVITYVSRQSWGRRMLRNEDHAVLVRELEKLREQEGYEVNIVEMDKISREEQIRLAGRTTIMMGVHGNGLTSLIWMNPTPRSTVIEFFYPGGFAFDYEYTTRALGMQHFGFWGTQSFTSPNVPPVAYPEGFQGNDIPLDGKAVVQLVRQRLSLDEELDD